MFPPQLIENNLSLLSGQKRLVLSLKIVLDEKNYSYKKHYLKTLNKLLDEEEQLNKE